MAEQRRVDSAAFKHQSLSCLHGRHLRITLRMCGQDAKHNNLSAVQPTMGLGSVCKEHMKTVCVCVCGHLSPGSRTRALGCSRTEELRRVWRRSPSGLATFKRDVKRLTWFSKFTSDCLMTNISHILVTHSTSIPQFSVLQRQPSRAVYWWGQRSGLPRSAGLSSRRPPDLYCRSCRGAADGGREESIV